MDLTQHGEDNHHHGNHHHDNSYHGNSYSNYNRHGSRSWSWGGLIGLAIAAFILYQALKSCFGAGNRCVCVCACVRACVRPLSITRVPHRQQAAATGTSYSGTADYIPHIIQHTEYSKSAIFSFRVLKLSGVNVCSTLYCVIHRFPDLLLCSPYQSWGKWWLGRILVWSCHWWDTGVPLW